MTHLLVTEALLIFQRSGKPIREEYLATDVNDKAFNNHPWGRFSYIKTTE